MVNDGAFTFRFQQVLDLREQQKQALEIEIGRAEAAINGALAARARWEATAEECAEGLGKARREGRIGEAHDYSKYLAHVRRQVAECHRRERELREEKERVREQLERAMRSCKVLENYRERLAREHRTAQEKAEDLVVDLHTMHKWIQGKRAQ
jgi:flagellar export protein FliJ